MYMLKCFIAYKYSISSVFNFWLLHFSGQYPACLLSKGRLEVSETNLQGLL